MHQSFSINNTPELDEWLALLHRPAPQSEDQKQLAAKWVAEFERGNVVGRNEILQGFDVVSRANDVEGLKRIAKCEIGKTAIAQTRLEPGWNDVTYCVAHMLVDGSGHEAFARSWINAWNMNDGHARAHANQLCRDAKRDLVGAQSLLALADITNILHTTEGNPSAPWWEMAWSIDDPESQRAQCTMLAAILRKHHPQEPPIAHTKNKFGRSVTKDLIGTMWTGNHDDLGFLLPAIGLAYGNDDPQITQKMREYIFPYIHLGQLDLESPYPNVDPRWDALKQWGGEGVATSILTSKVRNGDPFIYAAAKAPFDEVLPRIQLLQERGGHFDHPLTRTQVLGGSSDQSLLDAAVFEGNVNLTGHLLAIGCDPVRPANDYPHAANVITALQLAQEMADRHGESDPRRHEVLNIIRSAAAHKAAREALREMTFSSSNGVQP